MSLFWKVPTFRTRVPFADGVTVSDAWLLSQKSAEQLKLEVSTSNGRMFLTPGVSERVSGWKRAASQLFGVPLKPDDRAAAAAAAAAVQPSSSFISATAGMSFLDSYEADHALELDGESRLGIGLNRVVLELQVGDQVVLVARSCNKELLQDFHLSITSFAAEHCADKLVPATTLDKFLADSTSEDVGKGKAKSISSWYNEGEEDADADTATVSSQLPEDSDGEDGDDAPKFMQMQVKDWFDGEADGSRKNTGHTEEEDDDDKPKFMQMQVNDWFSGDAEPHAAQEESDVEQEHDDGAPQFMQLDVKVQDVADWYEDDGVADGRGFSSPHSDAPGRA